MLRAYGQRDPLNEYKTEAFTLFETMLDELRQTTTKVLAHIELQMDQGDTYITAQHPDPMMMEEEHLDPVSGMNEMAEEEMAMAGGGGLNGASPHRPARSRQAAQTIDPDDPSTWGKIPRNAPCPCGTGKKYKHCHGS